MSARTVSIVVPTLDNARLLEQCLAALHALSYPRDAVELIVADNSPGGATAELLARKFPDVRRLGMDSNQGFAVACNRGAAQASGEFVAFLNDDAIAAPDWIDALFEGLDAGGEGAVCVASHIRSRDGQEIEFAGASSNLFGVGRPRSVWGWPDAPEPPGRGSPLLFASGGAMLAHRRTFLDAGGFDPNFFAYFEDVDLGWRLWVLGHRVVYAPEAVVRHVGGATGSRLGAHRRYTLWETNSLATVLKNYESGNMERIFTAALLLLYKRALLSAGEAVQPEQYRLGGPRDTNEANVESISRVSVAHLAAVDRLNRLLPRFMEERARIQSLRRRPDSEILPLLGRLYERQFAGPFYAQAARKLAASLDLYGLSSPAAPNRILLVAPSQTPDVAEAVSTLSRSTRVAQAFLAGTSPAEPRPGVHFLSPDDAHLAGLIEQADVVVVFEGAESVPALATTITPMAAIGSAAAALPGAVRLSGTGDPRLLAFAIAPGAAL